jgi:asparagine synthase (glutamine-hydrolysing)
VRVPFLDPDLVRLANALPVDFKIRGRETKWILKRALESRLPPSVLARAKAGFGAPLRRWLRRDLRELVDDTLSEKTLRNRGLFDPPSVTRLVADDRSGRIDGAYTVFGLMCVEIWCRRFLDQAPGKFAA